MLKKNILFNELQSNSTELAPGPRLRLKRRREGIELMRFSTPLDLKLCPLTHPEGLRAETSTYARCGVNQQKS